jgi:hypothetical protein
MFRVVEYDTATGHREVVKEFQATDRHAGVLAALWRDIFANNDTETDHTYYVETVTTV